MKKPFLVSQSITKFIFCISCFSFSMNMSAQKTDLIFMENGDHLTCEIKWMEFGKVKIKVDDMSSIYIEWDAIDSIWSDRKFEVHFINGELDEMSLESDFYKHIKGDLNQVIKLAQIKNTFFNRLKGNASLGFNYDKSSDIFRLALDADITHRTYKKSTSLLLGTVFTQDDDMERTKKRNTRVIQNWFGNNGRSYSSWFGYEQNSELGLKGRLIGGSSFGKDFLNDQSALLFAGVGLAGNIEWSANAGIESKTNVEAVGMVEFRKFSYDYPELDINSKFTLYPSISQGGRIRIDWITNIKIEVVDDLFVGLKFYYHYDSKPINIGSSVTDWGTSLSFGYSF